MVEISERIRTQMGIGDGEPEADATEPRTTSPTSISTPRSPSTTERGGARSRPSPPYPQLGWVGGGGR